MRWSGFVLGPIGPLLIVVRSDWCDVGRAPIHSRIESSRSWAPICGRQKKPGIDILMEDVIVVTAYLAKVALEILCVSETHFFQRS